MNHRAIKFTIWLYFWLLLLEGVLRKWIFPQWSDVIFIIRDPLVAVTYLLAIVGRVFPARPAMVVVGLIALLSLAFSLASDSPFVVTLFGLRTNYLHLPLIFIMAQVMDREDVRRIGRWFMLTSIPIILLMWEQFVAEPDSWVNVGAKGQEFAQLRGAMGKIRPPGPFSFVSGVVAYFGIVASFVLYGWMQRGSYTRLLVLVATVVTALAIPISISRSLTFAVLVVGAFGFAVIARDIRRMPAYLGPIVATAVVLALVTDTIYMEAYVTRWEETVEAGSGGFSSNVIERMMDMFTQPFELAVGAPTFGHGVGMGTVAGARLSTGQYSFLLAESELARMVLELGPWLGFAFIGWRAWLAGVLIWGGWRHIRSTRDALAWLLAGSSFLSVLMGQWGPSTQLGFAVFGAGLSLAALNEPSGDAAEAEEEAEAEAEAEAAESDGEPADAK